MTNTEIIAAIRNEIERLKVNYLNRSYTFVPTAMQQLLDFIDTIESEKPLELDEEIKRFVAEYDYKRSEDILLIAIVARHFAQWGAEQILREVERWVEKNTCRYIDTQNDEEGYITDVFLENAFVDDLKKATKEIFTKWGAEHTPLPEDTVLFNKGVAEGKRLMMEEAVEGDYDCQYMTPAVFLDKYLDGIKDGDKVRVIVLPKED